MFECQSNFKLHMPIQSSINVLGHDGEVVGAIDIEHIACPMHTHFLGDIGQIELEMNPIKSVVVFDVRDCGIGN